MHRDFKQLLWSGIEKRQVHLLITRVGLGLMILACIYTSVMYLPLVYVALVSNLGPLLTAVISYLYLGVRLSTLETSILVISFVGVILLVTG